MRSRRDLRLIRRRPRREVPQMILVGLFVRQHLLARRLPGLWRHDRRCVHSEMSLPCPSPFRCHSLLLRILFALAASRPPFCHVANIKLDSVLTDVMRKSGRAIIEALITGETNPAKLASLAHQWMKASQEKLREALRGRVTKQHRAFISIRSIRSRQRWL